MLENIDIKPIKIKKLSSMVEDSIRALITSGQFKSGDRLPTEKEFSVKFGVSLITVREALRGLEAVGIIEKKRGKDGGIFIKHNSNSVKDAVVTFFSSQQFSIKDIDEVRENLQPFCARLAASRISKELMRALEQNVNDSEDKLSQYKGKFTEEAYHEIEQRNSEFHRLFGAATCNPILMLTVDYVEDFLLSYKRAPDIHESSEKIRQHRRIVECLKTGNPDETEKMMRAHVLSMKGHFLKKEKGSLKGKTKKSKASP